MALNARSREVWSSARIKVWPDPVILATFPRFAGDRVAAFAGRVGVRDAAAVSYTHLTLPTKRIV